MEGEPRASNERRSPEQRQHDHRERAHRKERAILERRAPPGPWRRGRNEPRRRERPLIRTLPAQPVGGVRDRDEQRDGKGERGEKRHLRLALARFDSKTYVAPVPTSSQERSPSTREPQAAAEVLLRTVTDPRKPLTIADAAAASGLPLRDAEVGLQWLTKEYRGRLRVGEKGDLVYSFPDGFTQPWKTREAFDRFVGAVGHGIVGVGRFVVRAWLMIALVGYAAIFLALMIAMAMGDRSDNRRSGGFGNLGLGFARLLGDALFWTFHPFSPFYVDPYGMGMGSRRRSRSEQPDVPFYEKVNRFVFGPTERPDDPLAMDRKVVAAIRSGKGRIGLADVMRVTGLPRSRVDAMMARLMLDYEGTVEVSDDGGIYYVFSEIRRTAGELAEAAPRPAWEKPMVLAPLTGNSGGANMAIGLLNLFNLVAAMWAIENHFTIGNLYTLFTAPPHAIIPPLTGLPVALGIVPLVMSVFLFLLPIGRALFRGRQEKKVAKENGRLAILREVLSRMSAKQPVTDRSLQKAWRVATGSDADSKTITREVVELGGDVDLEASEKEGGIRYRFEDLETEQAAIEEERAHAPDEEKRIGKIIFDA